MKTRGFFAQNIPMLCVLSLVGVWTVPSSVRADRILLKNGGVLEGTIAESTGIAKTGNTASRTVIVRLASGGAVAIAASDIERTERQNLVNEEYAWRSLQTPDTVEAHLALAEWCKKQSPQTPELTAGRELHLNRVLDLDSENETARQGLGYMKVDGAWTTREQEMKRQGRVLYHGRYVTQQEYELAEKKRTSKLTSNNWFRQVRNLVSALGGPQTDEAKRVLENLKDPAAVPALEKLVLQNQPLPVKITLIRALSSIGNADAISILADVAVDDPLEEARLASIDYLKKHDRTKAASQICSRFRDRDNSNARICRIGYALGQIGDPGAIGPLIDNLVTSHRIQLSGGSTAGGGAMTLAPTFSNAPNRGGGGFSFGGGGPQYETRLYNNAEVHDALVTLVELSGPKVDYGYNVEAWKKWFAAVNRTRPFDARRN
ncbi:MAG: HEAT repeat domain-containing protein [Thermoguttaceae bacterium]|nr:HEAT repeat domain-containing protein [Thermoguttaceae bacterium]